MGLTLNDLKKVCELGHVCDYVNNRITSSMNYISTENMLPNKGGISESTIIPPGTTTEYKIGDILISNIRPYFQKIWCADRCGGCSADVLCIRAKENTDSKYLYYLLSQQAFFDYVMSGAKGCKMPRGDKKQIMQWPVNIPAIDVQKKVVAILSSLDNKIRLNRRINDNLEEQAKALFKSWFVDNQEPTWEKKTLADIVNIWDSMRKPLSATERDKMQKIYPYYGATSLMDYVDNYLFDGIYLLMGEDGTVVDDKGFPILQYVYGKFWVNNHAHVLTGANGFSTECIYILLSTTNVKSIVTGAVQPKMNQANLKNIPIAIPPEDVLSDYNAVIHPLFAKIRNNSMEIHRLTIIRDALLPKLMSGELSVEEVSLD